MMESPAKRRRPISPGQQKQESQIYIIPAKIQKARLKILKENARKKGFNITDSYESAVTHIVTEFESLDQAAANVGVEVLDDNTEVINTRWLSECLKQGRIVEIEPEYRLKTAQKELDLKIEEKVPEYACMRVTLLKHHNENISKALEVLEEHAEYKEDYSRALAFRRGSCTVKSLSWSVTKISQIKGMPHIGKHCERVIQDILEDGTSSEVESILTSPWYKSMKILTNVFGVGPITAKKWVDMGIDSVESALANPDLQRKEDSRVAFGLAFYDDLNLTVTVDELLHIKDTVKKEAEAVLPGITIEAAGGFRRGKTTGHDVDLLISHPNEGDEKGVLQQIIRRLNSRGIVLYGKIEKSTYTDDVLQADTKGAYLRSTLDHFEKWIGVIRVNKSIRDGLNERQTEIGDKTDCKSNFDIDEDNKSTSTHEQLRTDSIDIASQLQEKGRDWYARRVDLIVVPASHYYYALVGWTGSKHFNRSLRLYAQRELNMKLSSHGLYDVSKKKSIPAKSEKDVFDNLKLSYREPHERNC